MPSCLPPLLSLLLCSCFFVMHPIFFGCIPILFYASHFFFLTHLFPGRRFDAQPLDGFYTGPSPDVLSGCLMGEHSNRNRHGQKSKPRVPLGRKAGDRWDWRGLPQDIAEEWWICIQVGVRGGFFQEQTGCEGAEGSCSEQGRPSRDESRCG